MAGLVAAGAGLLISFGLRWRMNEHVHQTNVSVSLNAGKATSFYLSVY